MIIGNKNPIYIRATFIYLKSVLTVLMFSKEIGMVGVDDIFNNALGAEIGFSVY